MKTKEEILDKNYQPKMHWKSVNRENVLKAMEIYTKESLFDFFMWFRTNGELYIDKSIEQMISVYLNQKNK